MKGGASRMSVQSTPSDLAASREPFSCQVLPERSFVRVRPIGSLDMATAPLVEQRLQELRDAGFHRLILDFSGLSFMDSTGLRLALALQSAAAQDGFTVGFVPGPPAVQRVFEVTQTTGYVSFSYC
jgi:anti-sigma B factor antagonist